MDGQIPGYETPIHRALTEPILMGGAPRSIAILNGTLAAAHPQIDLRASELVPKGRPLGPGRIVYAPTSDARCIGSLAPAAASVCVAFGFNSLGLRT
jgi:hypothetical protein